MGCQAFIKEFYADHSLNTESDPMKGVCIIITVILLFFFFFLFLSSLYVSVK